MPVTKRYQTYFISSDPDAGSVNLSQQGDQFQVVLDRPINIPRNAVDAHIRVLDSSIWNVVPNISADIGNNNLSYIVGGVQYSTLIPNGLYSLEGLEDFIQRDLTNKGLSPTAITLSGNSATQKSVLTFEAGVQLDLTVANAPTQILGFDARLVPLTPQVDGYSEEGDSTANFNRTEFFLISSDIVSNGIPVNSSSGSGVIHKALIQSQPGSQSNYLPYLPPIVDAGELIGQSKSSFNVRLSDQLGRRVSTQGEYFAFTMQLEYSINSETTNPLVEGQRSRWA